jgi:hypothetical protein
MAKLADFFAEDGGGKRAWNSPWVGIPLWVLAASFTVYWLNCVPPPGYAIGALAVVAGVMSVRDVKILGKISWVLLLVCLLITEFRAIDKDRADNEQKEKEFFATQQKGFGEISQQAGANFEQTTRGLETAINGLNSVLGTTQDVAKLAKRNLENITGGDSFAYLVVEPTEGAVGYSVNVFNNGSDILTGVTVRVARVRGERGSEGDYWLDSGPMHAIQMNNLGPHAHALMPDYWIYPLENGVLTTHFLAIISAQNGDVIQDIFFRPAAKGKAYAFRFTVKRPVPSKSVSGESNKPTKYKTLKTTGWVEPKPL